MTEGSRKNYIGLPVSEGEAHERRRGDREGRAERITIAVLLGMLALALLATGGWAPFVVLGSIA